jgi:hypothetical protein
VSRVAVVVPLRPDALETARRLVEAGPPVDLADTTLESHSVFLSDREAVFVFQGPDVRAVVERLIGEADVWAAATVWRGCLDGKPRIAETAYAWERRESAPLHVPGL